MKDKPATKEVIAVLKNLVGLAASATLAAGFVWPASAMAQPLGPRVSNGCTVGKVQAGPSPTNTVSLSKGECYKNGRTILTIVRYSYRQTDYANAQCGTSVNNRIGRSFTPRVKDTFYVLASFTVGPKYASSGVRSKTTGLVKLPLRHWQLQCGRIDANSSPKGICDTSAVAFVNLYDPNMMGGQPCGVALKQDSQFNGWLPNLNSGPVMFGNTVFSPPLATPGVDCKDVLQGARRFKWMGSPNLSERYRCGPMGASTQLTVYYLPPGEAQLCHDSIWYKYKNVFYSVGSYNLPYSSIARFRLPDDWPSWGGRLVLLYQAKYFQWPSLNNIDAGQEFSVTEIPLSTSPNAVNGCSELTSFVY